MRDTMQCLWNDENGAVLTAEYVLVTTVVVLGTIVGLEELAASVNFELNDLSNSIGALNQSYSITGYQGAGSFGIVKSRSSGSFWEDGVDVCDRNTSAEMVCGLLSAQGELLAP